jgi:hypothetical protein
MPVLIPVDLCHAHLPVGEKGWATLCQLMRRGTENWCCLDLRLRMNAFAQP